MAVSRGEVREAVGRIAGVWTTLARRDVLRQEIGEAVMRHAHRIEPIDLRAGVDTLLATRKAQQDDGGPAAPPGPHEVVGCILSARDGRVRDTPRPTRDGGITFRAWWDSMPPDEQQRHRALHRMMVGDDA